MREAALHVNVVGCLGLVRRGHRLDLVRQLRLAIHTTAQTVETGDNRHLRVTHKVAVPRKKNKHQLAAHAIVRGNAACRGHQRTTQFRRSKVFCLLAKETYAESEWCPSRPDLQEPEWALAKPHTVNARFCAWIESPSRCLWIEGATSFSAFSVLFTRSESSVILS